MGRQAFELLRPKDQFKVMQHFDLNTNHLEVLNPLYTPLIWNASSGFYISFYDQFVKDSHNGKYSIFLIIFL